MTVFGISAWAEQHDLLLLGHDIINNAANVDGTISKAHPAATSANVNETSSDSQAMNNSATSAQLVAPHCDPSAVERPKHWAVQRLWTTSEAHPAATSANVNGTSSDGQAMNSSATSAQLVAPHCNPSAVERPIHRAVRRIRNENAPRNNSNSSHNDHGNNNNANNKNTCGEDSGQPSRRLREIGVRTPTRLILLPRRVRLLERLPRSREL